MVRFGEPILGSIESEKSSIYVSLQKAVLDLF